jgi:hypothetical protein
MISEICHLNGMESCQSKRTPAPWRRSSDRLQHFDLLRGGLREVASKALAEVVVYGNDFLMDEKLGLLGADEDGDEIRLENAADITSDLQSQTKS